MHLIQSQTVTETIAKLNVNLLKPKKDRKKRKDKFSRENLLIQNDLENYLKETYSQDVYDFLLQNMNFHDSSHLLLETGSLLNLVKEPENKYKRIINLKRVNDIRYINKFFEAVNSKLPVGGIFAGCVETKNLRKRQILDKYPKGINYGIYFLEYIFKRVFPKLWGIKKIYFFLTQGNNRVITRAETLGRLISCGFRIKEQKNINGNLYFVAIKEKKPSFPESATYGPIIKLSRVGKGGRMITVYKIRTMHPYSEFLQDYVYKQNNLELNGKFKDDFRISTFGKILRKTWLDELPMIYNLLKGDLKIVGVRPISKHYFNLYSTQLKEKRILYKPGLVPPFYADLPQTLDEIMGSELKYLEAYEKQPLLTDIRYFLKAVKNILFKKARSS